MLKLVCPSCWEEREFLFRDVRILEERGYLL
jgi:hypothetical protein